MYGFWWHKPFNVERRHVVVKPIRYNGTNIGVSPRAAFFVSSYSISSDVLFRDLDRRVADVRWKDDLRRMFGLYAEILVLLRLTIDTSLLKLLLPMVSFYATGALFSAVHLVAWSWTFPSPLSQLLWRYSAITALVTSFTPIYILAFIRAGMALPRLLRISYSDSTLEAFALALAMVIAALMCIRIRRLADNYFVSHVLLLCFDAGEHVSSGRVGGIVPHFGA